MLKRAATLIYPLPRSAGRGDTAFDIGVFNLTAGDQLRITVTAVLPPGLASAAEPKWVNNITGVEADRTIRLIPPPIQQFSSKKRFLRKVCV